MTDFAVGDLVEAVKGEIKYRARTHAGFVTGEIQLTGVGAIDRLAEDGFTVTVIEKALPPLPTEPGVYLPYTYPDGRTPNVWLRKTSGQWLELPNDDGYEVALLSESDLRRHASTLTRLAPVAEVLGKVRARYEGSLATTMIEDFTAVAAEYGVSLD